MITARDEVTSTRLAEHGGRLALTGVVRYDFSVCLNAFGMAGTVLRAIQDARTAEYPDPYSRLPRSAAASRWQRPISEIMLGAGAAELIHAVCFAYLRSGDRVLIAEPAFGEYARAASLCGAQPLMIPAIRDVCCSPNLALLAVEIRRLRPRLVFIASPVSPTGEVLALDALREIANACRAVGSLLVLDQAYDAFTETPAGTPSLPGHDHVIHLRSLTKEHALAGIRVAFAVAAPAIVTALESVRVPWAASAIAQSAATAAMTDDAAAHVLRTTAALRTEASRIAAASISLGLQVSVSSTHFLVIRCGSGHTVRDILLKQHGILVRDCASFGMPEWIRVAARTTPDTDALIAALDTVLSVHRESKYTRTIRDRA
jgi:histidinol-phosphate/aromatic aminotransferase/cobyric acid decarboxylase-like protein